MKFHSRTGLVSNSSGEVFVLKRSQLPDNWREIVNTLWKLYYNEHKNDIYSHMDRFDENTDAASWFGFDSMKDEDDIHYGRQYSKEDAVRAFLHRAYDDVRHNSPFPGNISSADLDRALFREGLEDLKELVYYYEELAEQYYAEEGGSYWLYDAEEYVAQLIVEMDLFDEVEGLVEAMCMLEGRFGQWRYVLHDFQLYHAYQDAELQGEIDDHCYPSDFVHHIADTFGWFCYHNG